MRLRLLTAFLVLVLAGCGGSDDDDGDPEPAAQAPATTAPSPTPPAAPEPEADTSSGDDDGDAPAAEPLPGLPPWTAGYRRWTKLNDSPLPERETDPHRGTKNVFASRAARRNGTFPAGTVVVKEAYRPGKDFVGLIAAMRKAPGRNPQHRDWVFVEWTRESPGEAFGELARGDVCTACHVGAADRDYVFTAG